MSSPVFSDRIIATKCMCLHKKHNIVLFENILASRSVAPAAVAKKFRPMFGNALPGNFGAATKSGPQKQRSPLRPLSNAHMCVVVLLFLCKHVSIAMHVCATQGSTIGRSTRRKANAVFVIMCSRTSACVFSDDVTKIELINIDRSMDFFIMG